MKKFLLGLVAGFIAFITIVILDRRNASSVAKIAASIEGAKDRMRLTDSQYSAQVRQIKKEVKAVHKEQVKEEFLAKFGY